MSSEVGTAPKVGTAGGTRADLTFRTFPLPELVMQRSIEDVQQQDADYRAAARAAAPPNQAAEADALVAIFNDPSVCAVCSAKLGHSRWQSACLDRWQTWCMDPSRAGAQVLAVVDRLEASHLLATSIKQRLDDGVQEACFGLATLLSNFPDKVTQTPEQLE